MERGTCIIEGCDNLKAKNHKSKVTGLWSYKPMCTNHTKAYYGIPMGVRAYMKYKKAICEKCGFVPEHSCQLDVDHIDGNHKNNEETNLQTLCANCHRLKTYENGEFRLELREGC